MNRLQTCRDKNTLVNILSSGLFLSCKFKLRNKILVFQPKHIGQAIFLRGIDKKIYLSTHGQG